MIESPVSHPLRKWTQTEVYLKWFGKNWRKYIWRPGRVLLQVKWGNMSIVELLITGSVSSSRPVVLMLSCQDRRQCGGERRERPSDILVSISWQEPRGENAHTISIYVQYLVVIVIYLDFFCCYIKLWKSQTKVTFGTLTVCCNSL